MDQEVKKPADPAVGVAINYYQPGGDKVTIAAGVDGHLEGAKCPACSEEAIYAGAVMELRTVALAGVTPKFGGEVGVQLTCGNPACNLPPSPIVNHRNPRSYERRDVDSKR